MPDTFTPALQCRLMAVGAYNNTWGSTLNTDTLTLLDNGIAGTSAVNLVSATTYAFPAMTQGGQSVSRYAMLSFAGTPASPVTATLDASITTKSYFIENLCGQPITFKYSGAGRTAVVANNEVAIIWADGTNVDIVSVQTLGQAGVTQIARGGTGATTAAAARTALGLPSWDTAASANTLAQRDSSGHLFATYFNQSSGESENPTIGQIFVESNAADGYLRKASPDHVLEALLLSGAVTIQADPGGTPANGTPGTLVWYY